MNNQMVSPRTGITVEGGFTGATAPATCPAFPGTVTDGELISYCLGPVATYASTTYAPGNLWSAAYSGETTGPGGYAPGQIYQVWQGGASSGTNPITSSNFLTQSEGQTKDGAQGFTFLGFNLAWSPGLFLTNGMNYVSGGNVYAVRATAPVAAGHACTGFMVGVSPNEVEGSGYNPRSLSTTSSVRFTCTLYYNPVAGATTQVILARTDGGVWIPNTNIDVLYNPSSICVTKDGASSPTDEQCVGGLIAGNEGIPAGGFSPSLWQGMPSQAALTTNLKP